MTRVHYSSKGRVKQEEEKPAEKLPAHGKYSLSAKKEQVEKGLNEVNGGQYLGSFHTDKRKKKDKNQSSARDLTDQIRELLFSALILAAGLVAGWLACGNFSGVISDFPILPVLVFLCIVNNRKAIKIL